LLNTKTGLNARNKKSGRQSWPDWPGKSFEKLALPEQHAGRNSFDFRGPSLLVAGLIVN
jgi:hypothetical protein